jgi:hypothetical protein
MAEAIGADVAEACRQAAVGSPANLPDPSVTLERLNELPKDEQEIVDLFVEALWHRRFSAATPKINEGQGGYSSVADMLKAKKKQRQIKG